METSNVEVTNVAELVARACRTHASQVAIQEASRAVTFADLDRRSSALANALAGLGVQRGDRVGIFLPNCIEIVEIELACYKAAFVKAPMNARLSAVEAAAMIENSEPAIVVTTRDRVEALRPYLKAPEPKLVCVDSNSTNLPAYEQLLEAANDQFKPVRVYRDELAVLHYTSGSSGVLKAAMQTFGNRLAQVRKFLTSPDFQRRGDAMGLAGPITHASGMYVVPSLCVGARIQLFASFHPGKFLAEMKAERVTHTLLVPTMINMLLEELGGKYLPLPDLKVLTYGAAPIAPARILRAMDVFGPVLSQGYGAGETTSAVCALTLDDHMHSRATRPERLASCGRPYVECAVDVLDPDGVPVAAGAVGEIVVSGPDVFAGYWRAPELTAEVLKCGRYHTGDLAKVDEEGFISIVDRAKDMIISGGFNVYPSEVEAVLYQHPAIAEACVFSVPDEKWGETVAAHVVLKAGASADRQALDQFCADRLANFKRPRRVEFVDALNKNANGKVARKAIQAPYWSGHSRRVN